MGKGNGTKTSENMIDNDTKKRLIDELEKDANILGTCRKIGIAPATFYRWKKGDSGFRKKVQQAEQIGRRNMTDVAEQALMLKVKEKDLGAIKWVLSHNSERYKPKNKKIILEHLNQSKEQQKLYSEKERKKIDDLSEEIRLLGEELRNISDEE